MRILLPLALASLTACASIPSGVRVWVEAPLRVRLGEEFHIAAVVQNDSSRSIELVDLDIADSYLRGIGIDSTVPRFIELMHVPVDNTMSYRFKLPAEPGQTLTVRINAVAEKAGTYQGDFDFCINSMMSCIYHTVTTVVLE